MNFWIKICFPLHFVYIFEVLLRQEIEGVEIVKKGNLVSIPRPGHLPWSYLEDQERQTSPAEAPCR